MIDDSTTYYEKASQFFFRAETRKNHKCERCLSPLWTAVNPGETSDWVKIGGYGWVFRHRAEEHTEKVQNEAVWEKLREIQEHPEQKFTPSGACRRYPLSSYIKRMYKGRIDGLICDELHQYNNNSGQGDAMFEVFSAAKKVIGMTATLINGYSSGIFYLLYRTMPTAELAERQGLTVKQITNFVHRESTERWARKCKDVLSKINSENGRRGGRPKKKS